MKQNRHFLFNKKILPYVGMMIVVIVAGYFAKQNYNNFEKAVGDQARRQLLDTVRFEGRLLNQQALDLTREVEMLSKEPVVRDAFLDRYNQTTMERFFFLEDSYKNIKSLAASLRLLNTRGVVIYKAPLKDDLGKDVSAEGAVRPELSAYPVPAVEVINTTSGVPVLTFDQPIFRREKVVGLLRAMIRLETIHSFLSHHEGGDTYSFLLDQEGRLLSYPDVKYLGKNIMTLFRDNNLLLKDSRFEAVMERIRKGEEGFGGCRLFPLNSPHRAGEVIVAFTPVFFGEKMWSLITVIDYDAIAGPIKKNARDNAFFAGFVVLMLSVSAGAYYWDQKKKNNELRRLYEDLAKNLVELRSAQSRLIQSEKMEVVGKLAAGVAHEVKNPLAIILIAAGYLKNHVKFQDGTAVSIIKDIENAVKRADMIVKGLLGFSSTSELEKNAQDVHVFIEKSLLLVKTLLVEKKIQVVKDFGKGIPGVSLDGNKIQQVFINLFMNAIQSMPSGGELGIKTFQEESGDGQHWVVIWIEDAGEGISESAMKDLFVPFVTTKRVIGGTGLGLSIVKNIMEMHEGKIALENKTEGRGVRVTLWLKIDKEVDHG